MIGSSRLHTKHVWMAGGDRQDRSSLERCLHSTVVDISDRIPEHRTLVCHDKLGGLADPDFWLRPDPDKSRLVLLQHCLLALLRQPVQREPLCPSSGTCCRSSAQIGQAPGVSSSRSTAQVAQISMVGPFQSSGGLFFALFTFGHSPECPDYGTRNCPRKRGLCGITGVGGGLLAPRQGCWPEMPPTCIRRREGRG